MTDPMLDPSLDEAPRPRVTARSVAIWGARATGGLVGVGIAVAVGAAALFVELPVLSATAPVVVVEPEPAPQALVCPGPLLRLADDTGQNASAATAIGEVPYVAFGALSGDVRTSALLQADTGTGGTRLAPQVAFVSPVDGAEPVAAGIQSTRVLATEGNVVGYASASCTQPALRSWIVGGSTQLGRTSLLTLINPSSVEATVDLSLAGESGPIAAAGLTGIVVPAGAQRVIPLSGFSLDQRAPVVGITSTGGNVAAFLQQSIIRTLVPGGVDLVGQQIPASELVLPGIVVAGQDALAAINTTPIDEDDTMPTLRLYAPGGGEVEATVAVVPTGDSLASALEHPRADELDPLTDAHDHVPDAPEASSFVVTVRAGAVAEVPIGGLAAGEYTVVVTAPEPLVGAVRVSTIGAAGIDFAWSAPAPGLGERAVVMTPDADEVVLSIANPTSEDRAVTLRGPSGEIALDLPAGTTVSTEVPARAKLELTGMSGLSAAVRSGADGLIAQSPLLAPPRLASPVDVNV